jgi:predicted ribosome quality control (RQC) complex YloA/Tae2 family protein
MGVTMCINNKDYQISIGRNALENDQIIRSSNPLDIWFHYYNISGPHIVIHSNGDKIPNKAIKNIGRLLFEYKRVPRNTKVIYTQIRHVKCTKVPGMVTTSNVIVLSGLQ